MSTVRVYVNGRGVDVPADGTALDAVRLAEPEAAQELVSGQRSLTDSRGLPAPANAPVHNGAIFRLVAVRDRSSAAQLAGDDIEDER